MYATAKTEEQFASGEVCWLLNGGETQAETPVFFQTIGEDAFPVLDSTHNTVYRTSPCVSYSNTSENRNHSLDSFTKVEATCTTNGHEAYWYCKDCGKYFSNEACADTDVIADINAWKTGDGKLSAKGHNYGDDDLCTVCHKDRYEKGECGENASYKLDTETGILTISGTGAIWDRAFYGNTQIKEVVIENGITIIGSSAFYGCTSLTSITIPDSVTSIGDDAFYSCQALESIKAPCTLKNNASIADAVSEFGTVVTWSHVFAGAADTCNCGEISNIKNARLILDGILKVEIAFNTEITEADGWTINGKAVSTKNKTYIFEASAKDFNCDIVVMHGNEKTTFSVSEMLETYKENDKIKAVAEPLEAYCKAAEDYFAENGEVADYHDKWESVKDSITPFDTTSMGANYYGSSLLLKSGIILRHYYTSKVDNYTGTKDGYYYIDEAVCAHEYSCNGKYSVNDYIYKVLSSDEYDDKLKNLCVAIYNYGVAAENYDNGGNN